MLDFPEAGYTPANLRALLQHAGLTQQSAAAMLGSDIATVQRWLAETNKSSHRDMPLEQWRNLLDRAIKNPTA